MGGLLHAGAHARDVIGRHGVQETNGQLTAHSLNAVSKEAVGHCPVEERGDDAAVELPGVTLEDLLA